MTPAITLLTALSAAAAWRFWSVAQALGDADPTLAYEDAVDTAALCEGSVHNRKRLADEDLIEARRVLLNAEASLKSAIGDIPFALNAGDRAIMEASGSLIEARQAVRRATARRPELDLNAEGLNAEISHPVARLRSRNPIAWFATMLVVPHALLGLGSWFAMRTQLAETAADARALRKRISLYAPPATPVRVTRVETRQPMPPALAAHAA